MKRIVIILYICIASLWANIIQAEDFSSANGDVTSLDWANEQGFTLLDLAHSYLDKSSSPSIFKETFQMTGKSFKLGLVHYGCITSHTTSLVQVNLGKLKEILLMLSLWDEIGNPSRYVEVIASITEKNFNRDRKASQSSYDFNDIKNFSDATDLGTKRVIVP